MVNIFHNDVVLENKLFKNTFSVLYFTSFLKLLQENLYGLGNFKHSKIFN